MAQLVTLGETMAAFAPDRIGPLRYVSSYGIDFNCGLLFRPWLRVILPEQSASMPFCFVCW